MPAHDFKCRECNHKFLESMSMAEYEKFVPKCPECGSKNIGQTFGVHINSSGLHGRPSRNPIDWMKKRRAHDEK